MFLMIIWMRANPNKMHTNAKLLRLLNANAKVFIP